MTPITTPGVAMLALWPTVALAATGLIIVLQRATVRRSPQLLPLNLFTALVGTLVAGGALWLQWVDLDERAGTPASVGYTTWDGMIALDRFAIVTGAIIVASTFLVLLLSWSYLRRESLPASEYLALILFSATGMLAMTIANDLIIVFVALEVLSIPLYVLAALDRRRLGSQEAGFKYFLLGSFSSAMFLFGVVFVYGATGTTRLVGTAEQASIARFLAENVLVGSGLLLVGIVLMLVGLGFKVGAVPFHQWIPDVYDGAPTPITALMASAVKVAGFVALIRVLETGFQTYADDWRPIIWALSALSLLVGSMAAIVQNDVKRMLAYSSIAHAGYVLMGVQAASSDGVAAAVFYLMVYALMVVGSFAVVGLVAQRHDSDHSLESYRGLSRREPALAALFTFFLLSQAGVPLTGGFVAKFVVFSAEIEVGQYWLALIGMLAAVISAFMYLRIVVSMYAGSDRDVDLPAEESAEPVGASGGIVVASRVGSRVRIDVLTGIVLVVSTLKVLYLGLFPQEALEIVRQATLLIF